MMWKNKYVCQILNIYELHKNFMAVKQIWLQISNI